MTALDEDTLRYIRAQQGKLPGKGPEERQRIYTLIGIAVLDMLSDKLGPVRTHTLAELKKKYQGDAP